nr:hypothetical protein [Streptomyces chryseus]
MVDTGRLEDHALVRPAQLEAVPAAAALIGISTDGRAIAVDIDDAPHVLVCTGSGGGTTILRTIIAQLLHQGAHALILDAKRVAHLWAKDLPTVTHRGNVAGIHDALVGLATERQRRLDLYGDLDGVPRLMVVYMAIMSLDPTGQGRKRWTQRWKAALNAVDITFDGRLSASRH